MAKRNKKLYDQQGNEAVLPYENKKKTDWGAIAFIVIFLSVHVIWFVVFWVFVNFGSIRLAFFDTFTGEYTGKFFLDALYGIFSPAKATNNLFQQLSMATINTVIFAVRDSVIIFFHLFISYFLYKRIKGFRAFQIIFYLPSIISEVALAMAFKFTIGDTGPIAEIVGPTYVNLLGLKAGPWVPFVTILIYTTWLGWGGNMLLLGGALARVPVEVLESARLDGITSGKELTHMILPMVWPTMSTLFLLKLTTLFTSTGPVLLLSGNKSYENGTINIAVWIYKVVESSDPNRENIVSAAGLIFTAIAVPLVMFLKWLVERVPTVEY